MRKCALFLSLCGAILFYGGSVKRAGAETDDEFELNKEKRVKIAQQDPRYNAQFNPDDYIRMIAINLLKTEENEGLIIQKAFHDSNWCVREAAVRKLDSPKYTDLLWEIFWNDDSDNVKTSALVYLLDNLSSPEKEFLQSEFLGIVLKYPDSTICFEIMLPALDQQKNQEFFAYLVGRIIIKNDGHITGPCTLALLRMNQEEKIKLLEYIENHFPPNDEGVFRKSLYNRGAR